MFKSKENGVICSHMYIYTYPQKHINTDAHMRESIQEWTK